MNLHYETVSPDLLKSLRKLMGSPAFSPFYLVGGTALSLRLGHRISVDIDLFSDIPYGTLDLASIKRELSKLFPHTDNLDCLDSRNMIYTIYVGDNRDSEIKLDLCYDDHPIFPIETIDGIRMASVKDIAAMKMLSITTGCRRKDYWDIHELLRYHSLSDMISWGTKRYPYSLTENEIIDTLAEVWNLSDRTDVITLRGNFWEFIADDITDVVENYRTRHK